jgi:4-hydroxy-2-oxoheptanedioate aldolase
MGVAPRAEISHPGQARSYLEMGVRHFCMGGDLDVLFKYYKDEGGAMRDLLKDA